MLSERARLGIEVSKDRDFGYEVAPDASVECGRRTGSRRERHSLSLRARPPGRFSLFGRSDVIQYGTDVQL